MVSVERLIEYMNLKVEPLYTGRRISPVWPLNGEIKFDNVSLSYDKKQGNALNHINITIDSCDKIGIMGRTGSGKSSFIHSIFRLYEISEGNISIDLVNIKELSLHDLRSRLTIIPVNNLLRLPYRTELVVI